VSAALSFSSTETGKPQDSSSFSIHWQYGEKSNPGTGFNSEKSKSKSNMKEKLIFQAAAAAKSGSFPSNERGNGMKKTTVLGMFIAAALLCGCQRASATADHEEFWQRDYDAALKQAANENKYVLVNISGLQWCHWCKVLESEVFSQPEFSGYARENLICVLLDFNRSGRAVDQTFAKQHEMLLEQYKVPGFPTVLILNPQGQVIHRTGYQRGGPQAYVEMLQSAIRANRKD
jgi:protein disulfide-isomerase